MKKRRVSITAQSVIVVCILLLLVNFILGFILLSKSRTLIRDLINDRMLDIVDTSADMLDGDALERVTEEDQGSEEFMKIFNTLKVFQDNINLEFIYAVRDMGDGTFIFIVDPAEQDAAEYGEEVKVTDALLTAASGVPAADTVPYMDKWGKFYSAYSPVWDSDGNVAGIVCVDFSATWYEDQISHYAVIVAFFSVFSLLVGAAVVFLITTRFRSRLGALNYELQELTEDVDELLREINTGSDREAVDSENETSGQTSSGDEMEKLSQRIQAVRNNLREHLDHMHAQANGMITAMASDYRSVYYIDLDKDEGICYRAYKDLDNAVKDGEKFCFSEVFADYARKYVADSDRDEFLRIISPENIRAELDHESIVAHRYMVKRNGQESYEMLRMAGVRHPEDRDDHIIHAVGVGFTDVDKETRESLLQRQALSDALSAAEEANLAKTVFLSNMSHEIRTPMNAIIGMDRIALSDPGISDKTRDQLEKIGAAADHLLDIINDVLDMSRIESGRMTINSEEFSLPELLDQINTMVDSQCHDKGLNYECNIDDAAKAYFVGDAMKLKQVLINILGNAVKFTPQGGKITFDIKRTAHFKGRSTLNFRMSDTGIGMDESYLPRIFDAFSQENGSVQSKYGSTGLGMAITKNIVEMMNGDINVVSKKGKGTTFTVIITLPDGEHKEGKKEKHKAAAGAESAAGSDTVDILQGRRVLVAEDMLINAEIMKELLKMRGIETENAENGKLAVEAFESHEAGWYDAILMDMRMPVMDGLEATSAIRSSGREDGVTIPIIALTANAFDEDVQRSMQTGLDAHLSKPVEPDVLFATLEKLIGKRS